MTNKAVQEPAEWLQHGGFMGEKVRRMDWSRTPLGPLESWPQALRSAVLLMLESPFSMALCWGAEHTIIYNDAYNTLLGNKPEALGRPFLDVWAEVADMITPQIESCLAGQACHFKDAHFLLNRGEASEDAWLDYSFSPLRDEQGDVAGFLNIAVETTEKVLAHKSLELRGRQFQTLFQASPDPMLFVDWENGKIVEVNKAYCDFSGYSREEQLGKTSAMLQIWAERSERDDIRKIIRETGAARDFEARLQTRWGDIRTTLISVELLDIDGRLCFLAIIKDITFRKQTETALRESLQMFEQLVSAVQEGFCLREAASGEFIYQSPAFLNIMGFGSDANVSMAEFLEHLHPQDRQRVRRDLSQTGRGALKQHDGYRILRMDGQVRELRVQRFPIEDEHGTLVRVASVIRDVTEENERLRQMRQLRKLALDARENERRRMSRELHDGLTQLLGSARLQLESAANALEPPRRPPFLQIVELLRQGIGESRRLISDLRPLILDSYGLTPSLQWLGEVFRKANPGILLHEEYHQDDTRVPDLLRTIVFRIIQEGLHNASKHSKASRVDILLWQEDGALELRIRDDGQGLQPEMTGEFARADSRRFGLLGMRERVEIVDGTFELRSGAGSASGVEIRCRLPLASDFG